jgi:transposase-like protein
MNLVNVNRVIELFGVNLFRVYCPGCKEKMPIFRMPATMREMMFGGWTCKKCNCQMDKWGARL